MLNKHLIVETRPLAREENIILWNDYRITLLTDRLFRIEKDTTHSFCDDATLSIWFRDMKRVRARITKGNCSIEIKTSKVTLFLAEEFEKSYIKISRKKIAIDNDENLMGTYRTLDQYNGDKLVINGEVKCSIPMGTGVISKNGVAVYDDVKTPILSIDGIPAARTPEEMDIYVFAYGQDYREALKALYAICGTTPLIPRYAFGNWWSRYHAYTDREYLHVLDRLASRDLPFTVATIDMDWHWSTTLNDAKKIIESGKNDDLHGGINGWTGYSWNTNLFPDYKSFLNKIRDRNLKITLNLHPADGVRYFEDMYTEMAEAVGVDPKTEARIPFDITNPRFVNAYLDILHRPYEDDGVEFWWIDWQQGNYTNIPNLDPLWCLNHYHYLDNAKAHTPLILSRYADVGSHRYPLGFSGDTHITWDSLNYLPYFTSTASNVGYTWWSHDIGGHMLGSHDPELYTRFVQFGVFSPINRLHCSSWPAMTKEPSVYVNGTGLIAEEYLRLRHRMIPYLYSASYETRDNARALIEPLYYENPKDKNAYRFPNEYYFGTELLIAPITTPMDKSGMAQIKVWLPEGHWTDIFTGDEYDGGKTITMVRWLDSFPTLLKEGGIFVLDGRHHTNDASNPDVFDIMVANGNGTYTLHEDDEKGKRIDTVFKTVRVSDTVQTFDIYCGYKGALPKRNYRIAFKNIPTGDVKVIANDVAIPFTWDDDGHLVVTFTGAETMVNYHIEVTYQKTDVRKKRNERLLYSMIRFSGDYQYKNRLYKKLCEEDDETCRDLIRSSNYSATEKHRLMETLNA